MTPLFEIIGYLGALLRANWVAQFVEKRRMVMLAAFMLIQNQLYFLAWVVFFGSVRDVKGWHLQDLAVMYGICCFGIGSAAFLGDGIRTLFLKIQDGSFDLYLAKPRHPLPALLFSRSNAASLGDMCSAPIYWGLIAHMPLSRWPLLFSVSILGGAIFLSAMVIFYSLAFFLRRGGRLSDQLFETLIVFSAVPEHSQAFGLKVVLFTIMPAGFIGLLPVTLVRSFDVSLFLALVAATCVYAASAVATFNAGVRRYIAHA